MNSAHSPVEPKKSGMTRSIFRTLFMPEIKLSFGTTGMTHRAFLSIIATMFIQAGLLPYNHPARSMETIGHTTFRSIMGDAWYNLRNSGKNDFHQYGLFFAVFLLLSMAIMMVVTFAGQLFVSTASAQIPGGLFSSPAPDTDIGLTLIKNLIGAASVGEGNAHVAALGQLFSIYSYGVLVIASFMIAWSVISIVVDTAATGKFFGGRHNPVWWPIRLVLGLALLVPLGYGFNAGQYMVIQVAKWGSNLASNAWYVYVDAVVNEGTKSFVAEQYPVANLFSDAHKITQIRLCQAVRNNILEEKNKLGSRRTIVRHLNNSSDGLKKVVSYGEQSGMLGSGFFQDKDLCGSITTYKPANEVPRAFNEDPGDVDWSFISLANKIVNNTTIPADFQTIFEAAYEQTQLDAEVIANGFVKAYSASSNEFSTTNLSSVNLTDIYDTYNNYFTSMEAQIAAVASTANNEIKTVVGEAKTYGWPASALWYYIISSTNQRVSEAMQASAKVEVGDIAKGYKPSASTGGRSGRNRVKKKSPEYEKITSIMATFDEWWDTEVEKMQIAVETADPSIVSASSKRLAGQIRRAARIERAGGSSSGELEDTSDSGQSAEKGFASKIFDKLEVGTIIDLFVDDVRKAGLEGNDQVHPIVLMAEIGQKMIAFAELIILSALAIAGVVAVFSAGFLGALASGVVGMIFVIVGPLVIGGVILSIILPMTPFIRFVFAISGWMIAIIEAVVMVPIVALGHLRTDGEGIMGPMVQGSYVMMLQLLLRPVLIVIGLILSMFLVEVTVNYVNYLFFAMLDTLPIGQGHGLFLSSLIRFVGFGVMYGVLMYGLINSSFKLVDILPEAVVKYLGGGPSGGITDRDEGDLNRAVLASAVFASGVGAPSFGTAEQHARDKKPKDAATDGTPK